MIRPRTPYPLIVGILACCVLAASCTRAPAPQANALNELDFGIIELDPNHPFQKLVDQVTGRDSELAKLSRSSDDPVERGAAVSPRVRELMPLLETLNNDGQSLAEIGITGGKFMPSEVRWMRLLADALPYEAKNDKAQFNRQVNELLRFVEMNRSDPSSLLRSYLFAIEYSLMERMRESLPDLDAQTIAALKPRFFSGADQTLEILNDPEALVLDDRRSLAWLTRETRRTDHRGFNRNSFERGVTFAQQQIDDMEKHLAGLQSTPFWEWDFSGVETRSFATGDLEVLELYGDPESYSIRLRSTLAIASRLRLMGAQLAVEEYQRKTGKYPASLSEVTSQEQRIDPLTGKEFVYRLMPDGRYELGRIDEEGATKLVTP